MFFSFLGIIAAPLMRGLYYEPDLLPFHIFSASLVIVLILDILLKKEADALNFQDIAVFMLAAAYGVSFLKAVYLRGALKDILIYLNFFFIYIVTWQTIRKGADIARFINVMYIATLVIALFGLVAATGMINFPGAFENDVLMSTFQYKNAFGIFMVIGLLLALSMWLTSDSAFFKVIHALAIYVLTVCLLAAQSRASWSVYIIIMVLVSFILREKIKAISFVHIFFIGTGMFITRWFMPALIEHNAPRSFTALAAGAGVVLFLQLVYNAGYKWFNSLSENTQKIIFIGGIFYLALVGIIYISYINSAVPTIAEKFISADVASRASTIGAYDTSFEFRKRYIADGLAIGRSYFPLGAGGEAWNALYHQFQPFMYWTTEVHSHPVKIWIEAGLLGILAYLLIFISSLRNSLVFLSKIDSNDVKIKFFFLSVAMLALFIHSAFDFELSLPGMLFFAAVGLGIIRGSFSLTQKRRREINYKVYIPIAIGITFLLVTYCSEALKLNKAGEYAALGGKAMLDKNFRQAAAYYKEASKLDPLNNNYVFDLCQIYTAYGLQNSPKDLAEAKRLAIEAAKLNPYDIKMNAKLVEVFILQKDFKSAVGLAEHFVEIAPSNMDGYELLAKAYFSSLQNSVVSSDLSTKNIMISKLLTLNETILNKSHRLRRAGEFWQGRVIAPTPFTDLTFAKVLVIQGHYEQAQLILSKYIKHRDLGKDALLWNNVINFKLNKPLSEELSLSVKEAVLSIAQYLN